MVPSRTICTYKPFWLCWMVIFKALVGCHDILILGKSPIKRRQRPDMTLAVDWDVKHQFKQTKKPYLRIHTKSKKSLFLVKMAFSLLRSLKPRNKVMSFCCIPNFGVFKNVHFCTFCEWCLCFTLMRNHYPKLINMAPPPH